MNVHPHTEIFTGANIRRKADLISWLYFHVTCISVNHTPNMYTLIPNFCVPKFSLQLVGQ